MLITVMISSMSSLMFHVVLPQISEQFDLSLAQVSWLASAYTLIYAFGTVTYGKLADRFQLKTLITFGITLFAAGSLIGLVSESFAAALLARCLQSAGASAIPAISLIIPVRYFAPEHRGSAISMTAVGTALGSALAPFVSAFIVSFANWRWLFLPSLLILALLPLYRKYLEFEPNESPQAFDWIGGSLLASSVALLLVGATNQTWWCLMASLVAFLFFLARIRTAKAPFIDPKLFANRSYVVGLLLTFFIAGIGISLYFLPPILFAQVHRLESNWIGFAMVPAAIASSLLGRRGGKLADRKGNPFVLTLASGSIMTCFALLSTFTEISAAWIALFLILGNVGQSFMQIAMSNSVSATLPADRAGSGMGLFSMTSFVAQGIGSVVYGLAVEHGPTASWNPLHIGSAGVVFSNLYLVLAVLHAGILFVYRRQFITRNSFVSMKSTANQK
jgi:DHA2 family metal-tetracycline-proton antiporter-like MFS transporter